MTYEEIIYEQQQKIEKLEERIQDLKCKISELEQNCKRSS